MRCTVVEPVSRKHTRNVGLGRFIEQYRRIKNNLVKASNMYILTPTTPLCSTRALTSTDRPGSDAIFGERGNFKKVPTHTQDHGDA